VTRKPRSTADAKVALQMTSMIDVVFQLLAFFIMTFRIVASEGNLSLSMPSAPSAGVVLTPDQPVRVTLDADANGDLASIRFNETTLSGLSDLRARVATLVADDAQSRRTQEVEIDADYRLKYRYTLDALSQITGFVDPATGRPVTLVEKIKFTQSRPQTRKPSAATH
jgi:biopolymer transport protein ExbD